MLLYLICSAGQSNGVGDFVPDARWSDGQYPARRVRIIDMLQEARVLAHRTSKTLPPGTSIHDQNQLDAVVSTCRAEGRFAFDTEFESVENWAGTIEGTTSAGVGRLIRGVSWFSLNNEALAGLIETAIGVTLRKAAERTPGGSEAGPLGEFATYAGNGERLKIRLTLVAPDATLGEPRRE